MSFFLNFVRTSLLRSKKLYFLSRITKNVSFCLFLLKEIHIRKTSIFWRKPWTNPFAKCQYFLTFLELDFSGLKSILFYQEHKKMFLSGFFSSKKKNMKKGRYFDKNHGLTLCKMSIFLTLVEFHFSGLKRILFYLEYQKMFLYGFFCSKET